ncbi:unnamed protein product [Chrysoparadoxa australica]
MKLIHLVIIIPVLLSCQEDNLPLGFYDYQVVRLLGGDSSKTWFRTQYVENGQVAPISTCADSIYMHFLLTENHPKDSVDAFEIIPKSDCSTADTLLLGRFAAASVDNIFTDQLLFAEGPIDLIVVEDITSQFLKLSYERAGVGISASFQAVQE